MPGWSWWRSTGSRMPPSRLRVWLLTETTSTSKGVPLGAPGGILPVILTMAVSESRRTRIGVRFCVS